MESKCTICLDTLDERTTKTNCGHEFCSDCIFSNIAISKTNKNKCPNCREDICPPIEPAIGWSTQLHIEGLEEEVLSLSRQRHSLKQSNNNLNLIIENRRRSNFKLKSKNALLTGECEYYTIKYYENLKQKILLMDANRKLREQVKISHTRLSDYIDLYGSEGLTEECSSCYEKGHCADECLLMKNGSPRPCLNCKGQHAMKNCPGFSSVLLSDFTDDTAIRLRMEEDYRSRHDDTEEILPEEYSFFSTQNEENASEREVLDDIISGDSDDSLPDLIPMSNESDLSILPPYIPPTSIVTTTLMIHRVPPVSTQGEWQNRVQSAWNTERNLDYTYPWPPPAPRRHRFPVVVNVPMPMPSNLMPHESLRRDHYHIIDSIVEGRADVAPLDEEIEILD
jgi:hypothetical protein